MGVGEVSLIAARLVGRHGHVTALDIDDAALEMAAARARERERNNIEFVHAGIGEYAPPELVDAVIGRHILIHTPDPLAVLATARGLLRPGGVAVFQEFDFSHVPPSYPVCPLRERACAVFTDFFTRAAHGNMGARLFHLFTEAGFHAPDCQGEYLIDGGAESPAYEWFAESLRSILPRAAALGIGTEFVDGIDTLADRIREETVAARASCPSPLMIGGFARRP